MGMALGPGSLPRDPLIVEPSTPTSFPLCCTCPACFQPPRPGLTSPLWLWQGPGAPLMRLVTHSLESGRGRCPYSPHEPFTGLLVGKWERWERSVLGGAGSGAHALPCCLWLRSWAGAPAGARERSHPAEPGPALAHSGLAGPAQNHGRGVQSERLAHGGVRCHQPARLVPALWKGEEGWGLEAVLGHGSGAGCQPGCAPSTLPKTPRTQGCPARGPPTVGPSPPTAHSDPADGELYSGTSSDFMGSSAAFFRTWVHGAEQSYIRTEQNQDHWLHGRSRGTHGTGRRLGPALGPELRGLAPFSSPGRSTEGSSGQTHALACTLQPEHQEWGSASQVAGSPWGTLPTLSISLCSQGLPRTTQQGQIRAQGHTVLLLSPAEPAFVGAYAIPDTYNPHDDKVYIFFRETATEAGQWERRHIHARVARVCKVSHQRPACCARVSHWVGFYLLWATRPPKQGPAQGMGLSAQPPYRAESSGLRVFPCGD